MFAVPFSIQGEAIIPKCALLGSCREGGTVPFMIAPERKLDARRFVELCWLLVGVTLC
jgi:hypothetical protein